MVEEWLKRARNQHEVLPVDRRRSEQALVALQVSTRSPMGAIVLETGGIWFDHGWLRFLGGGGERFPFDLAQWNGLQGRREEALDGAMVVAWDVAGGFFAINGGMFDGTKGDVYYFAPDSLQWENLGVGFSGLLQWAVSCNLDEFYKDLRWPGWQSDIESVSGNEGFSFLPHRPVPVERLWRTALESMEEELILAVV